MISKGRGGGIIYNLKRLGRLRITKDEAHGRGQREEMVEGKCHNYFILNAYINMYIILYFIYIILYFIKIKNSIFFQRPCPILNTYNYLAVHNYL